MSYELQKTLIRFDDAQLRDVAERFGTPVWVYDAAVIRAQIARLRAFDVIRFAQKACSNIHILRLMREQGVKVDAVSGGEIQRALVAGYGTQADDLVYTADVVDDATLALICSRRIPLNAGSIEMLRQLGRCAPGHPVWLRINPGFGHGHSRKTNTGGENSKHGIWHDALPQALATVRRYGLQLVGLHMHIGSGVDYAHLAQVCDAMVAQALRLDCDIRAISAGGGLTVPYQSGEQPVDTQHYFTLWDQARARIAAHLGHPVTLEIEPGRFLVAEAGALISQVRAVKTVGQRRFVLVDAGFNDLMRPALYGSYHPITALTAAPAPLVDTVVAGPLCESGDVFTQREDGEVLTRSLPAVQVGDYLVFHHTGAYGASMSSNYNSRPLLPEVLLDNGQLRQIRRRQTIDDLLALEQPFP